jgi:hypothetical protein
MTVSVAFDGSVIDTADTAANWTAVKITAGGQAPTAVASGIAYEGTNGVTYRSDVKRVFMYTDIGAGNELDFSVSGANEGEIFYIWVNFLGASDLQLLASGGLGVFLESSTPSSSQYHLYYFLGRDNYAGGWVRLALDPRKTASASAGTAINLASIRYFGAFAETVNTARYDNFLIDQCAHGRGLIVTGTSTLGLVEELIADENTNRHGIVRPLNTSETAAGLNGRLILGDDVGTTATNIDDTDSKLFLEEPLYYETTLKASCPLDFAGLNIVGNATGATDVDLGVVVGTEQGRNGISIVGNPTYDFGIDRDDGAVESANFYGGSLENLTGTLSMDGTHDFDGQTMTGCGAVTFASNVYGLTSVTSGAITLNNNVLLTDALIINNTAASSVITNDLTDVVTCNFVSDGSNHAVDTGNITANTSMTWNNTESGYVTGTAGTSVDDKTPTGNETITCDVDSGFTLTINVAAGASTPSVANDGLGDVDVVVGQTNFKFTLNPSITGYEWRLYEASGTPGDGTIGTVELDGEESATADNQTYTYTHSVDQAIAVQILANGYEEYLHYDTLTDSDKDITFNLTPETNT